MLISDAPYGVTDEPWDKAWSKDEVKTILKQFAAVNKAEEWSAFFFHPARQTDNYMTALEEMGYKDLITLYWHKTDHGSQTPVSMHTSSVELGTLAYFPARAKNSVNLDRDPKYRHNHLDYPQLTKKYKDEHGVVANPCQKPPQVGAWIIGSVCVPGSTVLVAGPGAGGGEVLGAVMVGCHVVAIEKNRYQFDKLQAHLFKTKDNLQKQDEVKHKKGKDAEVDQIPESQEYSAGVQYSQIGGDAQQDEKVPQCLTCGHDITHAPTPCTTKECMEMEAVFHESCTVLIDGVRICTDCDRARQDVASQAATQVDE